MQTNEFLENVKNKIMEYVGNYEELEIIQVWYCKTIQNHKGLFIVKNNKLNTIYDYFIEATYNGDASELYLDFYQKQFKKTFVF